MIERQIVIGLIVSGEFTRRIRSIFEIKFLESASAQKLSTWALEYFDKYNEAPGLNIEQIYFDKLKAGDLEKDLAEDLEDTLADLSEEYEESFNLKYILDRTERHFQERHLQIHSDEVKSLLDSGDPDSIAEADRLSASYTPITFDISDDLDMSDPSVLDRVRGIFSEASEPVLEYPGALGAFWNEQMVRGGFIGILAREKLGKTFLLLDMAIRGTRQRSKVAFFQAGDMTESQQLKRTASYLAKKPTSKKYCGKIYIPVVDCVKNQLDTCDKEERESDFGPFDGDTQKELRNEITLAKLKTALEDNPKYEPCRNCKEFKHRYWGAPWIKEIQVDEPVDLNETLKLFEEFFINKKRRLRISTHANGTLSMEKIDTILDRWEKDDGFIADIILIDYADLLVTEKTKEFRHQQNQIWKDGRRLSQERNTLVIMPTQADAQSYKQRSLKLSNFSEDKRKYAHVTAMYGLNQDKESISREKKIGLLRINELVVREGDFDSASQVTVLQNLNIGRPYLGSFL